MSRYVDVCVNLLNRQFDPDRAEVVARARTAGVERMVLTATDLASARDLLAWHKPGCLYSTAGIHPHDVKDLPADWLGQLESLAAQPAVVAIGETGLDFNRNFSPRDTQLASFEQQIALACRVGKPLFVHDRESDGLVLELLGKYASTLPPTVIHCFTGSADELAAYLEAGYYIGITGWITEQKRGAELRALVPRIPLDRLLVETDAPFLKPHNLPADASGAKPSRRNEPALLPWVVAAIAEARQQPVAEVVQATYANALRFFAL